MVRISWEQSKQATEQLIAAAVPFEEGIFEQKTGLYVLVYQGTELGNRLWQEVKPRVIYLGYCSSDPMKHWRNNTGFSTVRRSLAAMLANNLNLHAVPRSDDIKDEDRFVNYKLDDASELMLSDWMQKNISVAFLPETAEQEKDTYQALLEYNLPILVFQNNPNNSFGAQIKFYRSLLAEEASGIARAL